MGDQDSRFANLKSSSFDPTRLLDRLNGDMELLRDLVVVFSRESSHMLDQIRMAIDNRAFADVQNFSHKLKGSALQLSGAKAAALSESLEEMGARKSLEGSLRLFADLKEEIASLTQSLKSVAESHEH